ncbi:MAG: TIGR03364 family FAD-dependent oxidoreductase [Pseudomonadota bacterium]
MSRVFDLAVVGAGILGLAHALAAARRGLSVVVIDREAEVVGASVRNFGFVTVSGQQQGTCWRRALRSRDVWDEVAAVAGIAVEQRGLLVVAQRADAMALLEAFHATTMGEGCTLMAPNDARRCHGDVLSTDRPLAGALWSPHERRVESRTAVPKLARWMSEALGVTIVRRLAVRDVTPGKVHTADGVFAAERVVICPGDDLVTLFPERIAALGLRRCRLHMLKVAPQPGFRLPGAVMSDLSLVRYLGYAELPEAAALLARLRAEQPRHLDHGVHLIAVQGGDGGLVVGDSHDEAWSPQPFADAAIDELIMDELLAVLDLPDVRIVERWIGTYASLPGTLMVCDAPDPSIRLVIVTSGTGASTAFAIGEETVAELFGEP